MAAAHQASVFRAILAPPRVWGPLGRAALAALAIDAALLGLALRLDRPHTPPPREDREELVVTLLERPPPLALQRPVPVAEAPAASEPAAAAAAALEVPAPRRARRAASLRPPAEEPPSPVPARDPAPVPAPDLVRAPAPASASDTAAESAQRASGESMPSGSTGPGGSGAVGPGTGGRGGTGTGVGGAGATTVLPFMDGMTRPALISKVDPAYTREARAAGASGLILTKCVITVSGRLERCRIVKGIPSMDQAVLTALSQWRYSPVLYQGKPTAVEYVIPIRLVGP